jgi:hypothetical protein
MSNLRQQKIDRIDLLVRSLAKFNLGQKVKSIIGDRTGVVRDIKVNVPGCKISYGVDYGGTWPYEESEEDLVPAE